MSMSRLSLLDALDQSFLPTTSDDEIEADSPPTNLFHQVPDIRSYFNGGESSKRTSHLDQLQAVQRSNAVNHANTLTNATLVPKSGRSSGTDTGGFRLNYDAITPLRSIDVGGPGQEQRLADFVTKSIENTSSNLNVQGAMKRLGLKSERDIIPGLEVRLLNHQCIGVAWMVEKEMSKDRGGILADDMGLGKTVQMIATMAMNMPKPGEACKTTLIVVPAAILQQWKDEIDSKSNGLFVAHIHHGKDKLKTFARMKSKDVIITSYQTFCQDFSVPPNVEHEDERDWLNEHGGLFARIKFYRVIADEAHFIRNRSTRASLSLSYVKATYRWMLTGTPVTNTLADIYGLLRFGRFQPWNDWASFNEHVAKVQGRDAPLAGSRAQAILKPILLRRTKNSTLDGKPLLQLPPKEIEIVKLKFSQEEREIYDFFERKTKFKVNKFIKENTVVKNHVFIFVLLLRLRQLCCHPYLTLCISNVFDDPGTSGAEKELSRAKKTMGSSWVTRVKDRFLRRTVNRDTAPISGELAEGESTCPNCHDLLMGDNGRVLACGHDICFDCTLELMSSPIVHDGVFGTGNEKENLATEKEYENAVAKGWRPCPTCRKMMDLKTPDKVFKASAFEPSEEEIQSYKGNQRNVEKVGTSKKPRSVAKEVPDELSSDSDDNLPDVVDILESKKGRAKRKAKSVTSDISMVDLTSSTGLLSKSKKRKMHADDSDIEFQDDHISHGKRRRSSPTTAIPVANGDALEGALATWGRGDDDMEPSTKMLQMIELLREWEASGDKTIIYSQWTSMLDLIERIFSRHGIRNLRFDGTMDRTERDDTLSAFKRHTSPKVMLISTKCGSVGLNLVAANRIINMDLSWNYAAESQAYDRCHRIGQEKAVHVKRLVVEDTIEDRMLKLQDVKTGLADAALGEGTGAKLQRLSVKDIKYLFGMGQEGKQSEQDSARS